MHRNPTSRYQIRQERAGVVWRRKNNLSHTQFTRIANVTKYHAIHIRFPLGNWILTSRWIKFQKTPSYKVGFTFPAITLLASSLLSCMCGSGNSPGVAVGLRWGKLSLPPRQTTFFDGSTKMEYSIIALSS